MMSKQLGFSLIELMIAVTLSLVLLMGAVQVLDSNQASANLQNNFGRVQESGRMAVEMMGKDIRNADFWGCPGSSFEMTDDPTDYSAPIFNHLNPGSGWESDLGNGGVGGVNNVSVATVIGGKTVKLGTDILILRGGTSQDNFIIDGDINPTAAVFQVEMPNPAIKCDIYLLTNCSDGELFQNTAPGLPNQPNMGHAPGQNCDAAGESGPGNAIKNFRTGYDPKNAMILSMFEYRYFIAPGADGNDSLYRARNGVASELIPGVNDLQVLFGEITNTTGYRYADVYVDASGVTDWAKVISVRAVYTVKGPNDNVVENGDGRLTRSYTVTGTIRNRVGS